MSTVHLIDAKTRYPELYAPKVDRPELVLVPKLLFMTIDGVGAPDSPGFAAAVGALYSVSYTLKFMRRKFGVKPDYSAGPLEGLWWSANGEPFQMGERDAWRWTLMLMQPVNISSEEFASAIEAARRKKPDSLQIGRVRLETFQEGEAVQILHLGAYADESRSVDQMMEFAAANGYKPAGKHHEIYLNDPSRTAPEKLKTILRVAVR